MGFSVGVLRALDSEAKTPADRAGSTLVLSDWKHPILNRFTPPARALLESLQRHQDRQLPWARVVGAASGQEIHWLDRRYHPHGRP
ncbi:hypothetical protein ACW9HR_37130 [Nocardia gipuzkoensis]